MDKQFYKLLLKNGLTSQIWEFVLELIENEISKNPLKVQYLIIFNIFFSLMDSGNICMSLDENTLIKKWFDKVNGYQILMSEKNNYDENDFNYIREISKETITNYLKDINESSLPSLIGTQKVFFIDSSYLYLYKYAVARESLQKSLKRIFLHSFETPKVFDYLKFKSNENFKLSNGQEMAVDYGLTKNLVITGGPGTGKTTSILYLLLNLLLFNGDYVVHLVAPSGKASSRMKESILGGIGNIKEEYRNKNVNLFNKISSLEESTIHRLLGYGSSEGEFIYNKENQFDPNSIFIIDEASMIDISMFASLLEAIPTGARVFIMGDKNQLPSVENGAVFGELLKMDLLKDYIVRLDESKRFAENTDIFKLAKAINNGEELNIKDEEWKDFGSFKIEELDLKRKPLFYYKDYKEGTKERDIINYVSKIWGEKFYKNLQALATDLDPNDYLALNSLFSITEESKILCSNNQGVRGVKEINEIIRRCCLDKAQKTSIPNEYCGQIMMVNKNIKNLDLYNGDTGVLVTFKDDETLYLMTKKSTKLLSEDKKVDNSIFKLKEFVFYPLRMIAKENIDLAYAITVHKSQGSDYKNILVILPGTKGHPLLIREIVYTAITRTKGNTYILSNRDRLEEAKNKVIVRDTNLN